MPPAEYADRALRAQAALERRFLRPDGLYRRSSRLHWPGAPEHLWPFARAFVATLDLGGLDAELTAEFDVAAAIVRHRRALERYWDASAPYPAYASDPPGTPFGGDRYYDDNAWVGLSWIQLERLQPGAGSLERVRELSAFAVSGWDHRPEPPHPGGVFWIEQGRGTGRRNHDRNTVSTAPNAQLRLHLAELTGADPAGDIEPAAMIDWVQTSLRSDSGLYWDKIDGDGSVDRALWSYNQGNMIGARVLQHRLSANGERTMAPGLVGGDGALREAEGIARRALDHYRGHWFNQPPAFHAILFRNLLLLHDVTADPGLRETITRALHDYAEQAWTEQRDRHDLLRPRRAAATVLHQSAFVSVLALAAWDPDRYRLLA